MDKFSKPLGNILTKDFNYEVVPKCNHSELLGYERLYLEASLCCQKDTNLSIRSNKKKPQTAAGGIPTPERKVLSKTLQEFATPHYRNVCVIPKDKLWKSDQPVRSPHFQGLHGQEGDLCVLVFHQRLVEISVNGEQPRFAGWKFHLAIQILKSSNQRKTC